MNNELSLPEKLTEKLPESKELPEKVLPAVVRQIRADMKRLSARNPALALEEEDWEVFTLLYYGDTPAAISRKLGMNRQRVHRRKATLFHALRLYYFTYYLSDLDDEGQQAYKALYQKLTQKEETG